MPTIKHMKTQYYTAASINGYLTDERNSLDWLFQFGVIEGMEKNYSQFINKIGAVAMGSVTYKWIIEHENLIEQPEKWPYKIPVWIFSNRNLPEVKGADIRFVHGDVAPVHTEMIKAAGGKNIWITGGGDLAGQFYDRGLLDEIIISVAPVILVSGAPLLPRNIVAPPMKLVDVQNYGNVFAVLTYEVQK